MLLIAFAFLPPAAQVRVATTACEQVCTYTATESPRPITDWVELLANLNPVLSWHPVEQQGTLLEAGWAQLLQFSGAYLRPVLASS